MGAVAYDWSHPQALRASVIDSNLFKPGALGAVGDPEDGAVGWRSKPYVALAC